MIVRCAHRGDEASYPVVKTGGEINLNCVIYFCKMNAAITGGMKAMTSGAEALKLAKANTGGIMKKSAMLARNNAKTNSFQEVSQLTIAVAINPGAATGIMILCSTLYLEHPSIRACLSSS